MSRTRFLSTSIALLGLILATAPHALGEPFKCRYTETEDQTIHIEFDADRSFYKRVSQLDATDGEEPHDEGAIVYDAMFVKQSGAIAVIVNVKGMRQGDLVTVDPYLIIFKMNADGKFIEVNDGKVGEGTCKPETAQADRSPNAAVNALTGDPFSRPWENPGTAIVLDPFKGNAIDWDKVQTDPRVTGIIHKASQGMAKDAKFEERRTAAKQKGYVWGSYHLLTTADVKLQIDHFLAIAGTDPKDSLAVDVECLAAASECQSASFKVSFAAIETALRRVNEKTGHFPLLYVNHSVAKALSERWQHNAEFSDVRLWYARFKSNVTDFPVGPWQGYALWQFSSEINCTATSCPYRVPGTAMDMDLNVYYGTPAQLRNRWPLER